jgi:hypothetical protein|tara:strand:+ start:515 stop:895 length:381 start_codon:yes stop_codon:yes gene_type:complete
MKMQDRVEQILNSKNWTFADLTNMSQLVKDFSNDIYGQLDAKEKLSIVWEKDITNIQSFGMFFQNLVTEEIQLQVASTLQEQLLTANVNFSNNKNKEENVNEIPEGSVGRKSSKKRKTDEASHSEE